MSRRHSLDYQATLHLLREIPKFLARGAMPALPALLEKLGLKGQGPEKTTSVTAEQPSVQTEIPVLGKGRG